MQQICRHTARAEVLEVGSISMTTGSGSEDEAEKLEIEVGRYRSRVTTTSRMTELCLRFVGNCV